MALGDLARERWFKATWERTVPEPAGSDPWPDAVPVDFESVRVGIARTEPAYGGRVEVRENERLHLAAIRGARKLIYMENQYFTSPVIAGALAERLAEPDGPEVVLVSTGRSPSWFDSMTMDTARAEVLFRLETADVHNRFLAFSPNTRGGERIIVHAKVTIVDDRLLRIGSTNINNRSLGFDTECDVAIAPDDAAGRERIRAYRHQTIGHFIGISGDAFATAEAVTGSTGKAIQDFNTGRLSPLGATPPSMVQRTIAEFQLGDPVSTADAFRPWKRRNRSQRPLPQTS